jgi:hypothetical protein
MAGASLWFVREGRKCIAERAGSSLIGGESRACDEQKQGGITHTGISGLKLVLTVGDLRRGRTHAICLIIDVWAGQSETTIETPGDALTGIRFPDVRTVDGPLRNQSTLYASEYTADVAVNRERVAVRRDAPSGHPR